MKKIAIFLLGAIVHLDIVKGVNQQESKYLQDENEDYEYEEDQNNLINLENHLEWSKTPMSNNQAKCYLARYPDLRRAFGNKNYNAAKFHWKHYGIREHRHKTCEKTLTNREALCYVDKYDGLKVAWGHLPHHEQIKNAKKHYLEYGITEERQRYCAPRITEQQSRCYLNRYPELIKRFGVGKNSWVQAQRHFYTHGFFQKKNYKCEGDQIESCADAKEGPDCKCPNDGTIYFGKMYNTGGNRRLPEKSTFEQMNQWKTVTAKPVGNRQRCDVRVLTDPWRGQLKQCFCEKKFHQVPIRIAQQNQHWQKVAPTSKAPPHLIRHQCSCQHTLLAREFVQKKYTVKQCNDLCVNNADCKTFVLGNTKRRNPHRPKTGHCFLYKAGCNHQNAHQHQCFRPTNWNKVGRPDVCPISSYVYYGRLHEEGNKGKKLGFRDMIKKPYERSLVKNQNVNHCSSHHLKIADFDEKNHKQCFCDYDNFYSDEKYNADQAKFDAIEKKNEADRLAAIKKREDDARRKAEEERAKEEEERKAALKRLREAERKTKSKRAERDRLQKINDEKNKDKPEEEKKEETKKPINWIGDIIQAIPNYKKYDHYSKKSKKEEK